MSSNNITRGKRVFRIKAMALLYLDAMYEECQREEWSHQTFYISRKELDNLTAQEVNEKYAEKIVSDIFYEQDGVLHIDAIVVRSVTKF